MKKRIFSIVLAFTLFCIGIVGCGKQDSENNDKNTDVKKTVYTGDGRIELTFWTTYGSKTLAYLEDIIDDFNESQDKYYVVPYNNGGHTEIRTKLLTSNKDNYPSLFCGTPATTSYYANSGVTVAIQDFIDADSDDWASKVYESVKNTYCDLDEKMWGYPLGVSCSGYFVNVDALKAAGYTVEDVTSFEKIVEIAKAITSKGICKYGLSFYATGIELVDMLTLQGVDMIDCENGFSGAPTKTVLLEGDNYKTMQKVAELFGSLYKEEIAMPYGTDTGGEAFPAFNSGKLAMLYATNSWAHYVIDGQPDFQYTFIPSVGVDENAEYKGYVLSEGTGMYIANTGNEEEMKGAYEFIKFVAKPENQSYWCQGLGYMPNTAEAAADEGYVSWMNTNLPASQDIIALIQQSPKELRTPYIECANELMSVGGTLFSYVSIDPNGDVKPYIEEVVNNLQEGIDIWVERKK